MSKSHRYLLASPLAAVLVFGLLLPAGASVAAALIDLDLDAGAGLSATSGSSNDGLDDAVTSTVMFDTSVSVDGEISVTRTEVEAEAGGSSAVSLAPEVVVTKADLQAYAFGALRSDENVEEMNFTTDTVEVRYKQRARLLALVPITVTARAIARADGTVEVKYPWYAFAAVVDNRAEIETQMRVAVDAALRARANSSVQLEGDIGADFSAAESAIIASQMQAVLQSNLESTVENES